MDSPDPFAAGIENLAAHITDLSQQILAEPRTPRSLLDMAFETMNTTLEELRVAEEEMRAQNDALFASQTVLETWRHYYQDLFESAPDAYLVTDLSGVILESNAAAMQMLGVSRRFLKGKPLGLFVAEPERLIFHNLLTEAVKAGIPLERETVFKPRRGAAFAAALTIAAVRSPGLEGAANSLRWLVRDVTGRNAAETDRYRALVEEVQDYAIFLADPQGRVTLWNQGAVRILGYPAEEMLGQPISRIFTSADREAAVPEKEMRRAAAEGRASENRWHLRKDGTQFWANGVTTALRDKSGQLRWYAKVLRDFTAQKEEEERLAQAYAREHRIAATLQHALLPNLPEDAFPGLTVAALYEAAWAEAQIGGDFFDAFALDNGRVALVVGDVSGKGLEAAAHTAEVKYALRAFLRESSQPGDALARLNTFICDNHHLNTWENQAKSQNAFVTLAVLVVQPSTGEAMAAVAGGEPPLLLHSDGSSEPISATGSLLGLVRDVEYPSVTLTLDAGDTVVLVTDGITEARQGLDFLDYAGLTRLAQEACCVLPVVQMGKAILEGARQFAGGALSDDACLLLVRLL